MKYSGSKIKFVPTYKELESGLSCDKFIEPFLGGGSIFANTRNFNSYVLNDLNDEIMCVFRAIKHSTYGDLLDAYNEMVERFGCIKTNKDSYYNFRNYYNKHYHHTDSIKKGLYLYFLINSTINGFARWGPNGFNNSFGNRFYMMDNETFVTINEKLNRGEILNTFANNVIENNNDENTLIFCDPPYIDAPTSYTNHFSESDFIEFLECIKENKSKIIYTDIFTKTASDILKYWDMFEIRKMRNTSPNRTFEFTGKTEVCFTNFNPVWCEKKYMEDFFNL